MLKRFGEHMIDIIMEYKTFEDIVKCLEEQTD